MLVSNQTNGVGNASRVMRDLISSCHAAQESFRSAAAVSGDWTVKRLFEIYAQQRTRFAHELSEHLPVCDENDRDSLETEWSLDAGDSLQTCLDRDLRTLELYRRALANRDLPTRTHFLIASQLALLERAHERVSSLLKHQPELTARPPGAEPVRARA